MLYNDLLLLNVDSGSNESVDFLSSFTQTYGASRTPHRAPSEKELKAFCASHPSMKPVWLFLCDLMKRKQDQNSFSFPSPSSSSSKRSSMTRDGALVPPKEKRTKSRRAHCRELRDSISLLEQKMRALSSDISAKSQSKVDEETKRETGLTSLLAWGGYTCALNQRKQTITLMKDSFAHLNAAQESTFRPGALERARRTMQDILAQSELMDMSDEKALIVWKMRTRKYCADKFRQAVHANDENKDLLDVCGCNANINKFICTLDKGCKPDTQDFSTEAATAGVLKRLGFARTPGLSYKSEVQKIFAERLEKDKRSRENLPRDDEAKSDFDVKSVAAAAAASDPKRLMSALRACRRYAAALDGKVKALSPYVALYEKVGGVRVVLKELNEGRAALMKGLALIVSDELARLFAVKKSVVKMESRTLIPKIQAAIGNIESFAKLGVPFFVISSLESADWLSWMRRDGGGNALRSHAIASRRGLARLAAAATGGGGGGGGGRSSAWDVPPMDFVGWSERLAQAERRKALPLVFSDKSLVSLVNTAKDTLMCCERHDREVVRGKWRAVLEALVEDILENGEGKLYRKVMQLHNEWQTSPGAFCLSWVTVDGLTFSQWLSGWKERCLQGSSRRRGGGYSLRK